MARLGITEKLLLILTLPVIGLSAIALWQVHASLSESALLQLKGQMLQLVQRYAAEVTTQLEKAEVIADSTAEVLAVNPTTDVERLYSLLNSNLERLSLVYGSALAYEPGYFPGKRLFAPYVYRAGEAGKARMDVAVEAYDYTQPEWEWWNAPRNERHGIWTKPFVDTGAGNILMVTYSTPIQADNHFIGVATVDLDLSAMHANLNLEGLRETDYVILTNSGHFAYHYSKAMIGKSYTQLINKLGLEKASYVASQMMAGENGFFEYHHDGTTDWVFYAPVGHFGWSFAVRVNLEDALRIAGMDKTPVYLWSAIVFIIAVLLTLFAARHLFVAPLRRLEDILGNPDLNVPPGTPGNLGSRQADRLLSKFSEMAELVQHRAAESAAQNTSLNQSLVDKTLQLKVFEKRQHALLDAARNATFIINPAGVVLATNNKAEQLLGGHRDEIVDVSLSHWVSTAQRSKFAAVVETLFSTLEQQVINSQQIATADDRALTVDAVFSPIYLPDGEMEADVIFVAEQQ